MSAFSDYFENAIINLMRNTAFSELATVYVALFTAVTGLEANNPTAEVAGGNGYTRKAVTLSAASGGATSNSAAVTFDEATGAWGTVTHFAIVDHETNTNWGTDVNVLMWVALDTAREVAVGNTIEFIIGALDITVA